MQLNNKKFVVSRSHLRTFNSYIYAENTLTFAMDLRKSALYFVAILVLLNGMTGGTVLDSTLSTLTSEDKAAFRS